MAGSPSSGRSVEWGSALIGSSLRLGERIAFCRPDSSGDRGRIPVDIHRRINGAIDSHKRSDGSVYGASSGPVLDGDRVVGDPVVVADQDPTGRFGDDGAFVVVTGEGAHVVERVEHRQRQEFG